VQLANEAQAMSCMQYYVQNPIMIRGRALYFDYSAGRADSRRSGAGLAPGPQALPMPAIVYSECR
jgi:hypothetical protein